MSLFRIILVILFGFGSSQLLMGMEKEQKVTKFKYSNPYFDSELRKVLLLLMQHNSDHENFPLNKDVIMVIVQKNYDLHYDQLLKSKIELDDFDYITMNDEGRRMFDKCTWAVQYYRYHGNQRYASGSWGVVKEKNKKLCGLIAQDEYKKILDVPLRLRSKAGLLCTLKVVEGSPISDLDFPRKYRVEAKLLVPEEYEESVFKEVITSNALTLHEQLIQESLETVQLDRFNVRNQE